MGCLSLLSPREWHFRQWLARDLGEITRVGVKVQFNANASQEALLHHEKPKGQKPQAMRPKTSSNFYMEHFWKKHKIGVRNLPSGLSSRTSNSGRN